MLSTFFLLFYHKLANSAASVVQLRYSTASFYDPTRPLSLLWVIVMEGQKAWLAVVGFFEGGFGKLQTMFDVTLLLLYL